MPSVRRSLEIIKEQKHPVKFLTSRILMKSGLNSYLTIGRNGYKLRFNNSALSAALWINPKERSSEEKFLRTLIEDDDIVLDIGANVGNISLALASLCKKVLAFEPHPKTFAYLQQNIALNKAVNITPYNLALGAEKEELHFSDQSDDSQNSISEEKTSLTVEVCTLDSIAPSEPIKLIKIDVEGYEGEVLSGAIKTSERAKYIYLECIEEALSKYGWGEEKIVALLQKRGFKINEIADGQIKPYNSQSLHKKKMLLAVNQNWK